MMQSSIGPFSFAAAAWAAGGVAAMVSSHLLRVRPVTRHVATLMFWSPHSRSRRATSLWSRRLAQRLTLALLCAIVLAAAAAMTADRWNARLDGRPLDVIVLDAAADPHAVVAAVGRDWPRMADIAVVRAGGNAALVSDAGEPAAVARRRIDESLASAATAEPTSDAAAALRLAAAVAGPRPGRLLWYTDRPAVPDGLPPAVADRIVVRRIAFGGGARIVGATFVPGEAGRGTLRVRLAGRATGAVSVRAVLSDGTAVERPATWVDGEADVAFDNVPADGGAVTLGIDRDPAASPVQVRLPDARPHTFRIERGLPPPLRAALLAVGEERQDGQIFVTPAGASLPAGTRAAIVVEDSPAAAGDGREDGAAKTFATVNATPAFGVRLDGVTAAVGPAGTLPGVPLLTAGAATLMSLDRRGPVATLHVSGRLVDDDAGLPRRAAFPLFLLRLCDAITGRQSMPPTVAALRAAQDPRWTGPAGRRLLPDVFQAPEPVTLLADRPPVPASGVDDALAALPIPHEFDWTLITLGLTLAFLCVETALLSLKKIV